MPQTIYLPKYTNPFEAMLPQFLSSMILQDQSQKFRERMLETQQAREEAKQKEDIGIKLATTEGVSELPTEPYATPPSGNVFTAGGKQYSYSKPRNAPTPFTMKTPEGKEVSGVYNHDGTVSWVPKEPKPEATHYETVTLKNPSNEKDQITRRRSDPEVDTKIKQGWLEVKTPSSQVNVNMPDNITPKVKSDLQTAMNEADASLDALNKVDLAFKPEYLEYFGKGKATVAKFADKVGVDVANKYLGEYTGWKALVDKQTFAYRKLVTGVAGGEKEMEAIQETYINTSKDSPETFKAKLAAFKENSTMAKERARYSLEHFGESFSDLTASKKADIAKKFPYITKLTLSNQGMSPDEEAADYLKNLGKK